MALPKTASDVFRLGKRDKVVFNSLISFFKVTGLWKYPVPASGDLETMKYMDLVYWLYKARYPVDRAARGAGLESFFETQKNFKWSLPQGFKVDSELSFSAVGDLMNHPFLKNSADVLYQAVEDLIFGVDFATANLECVLYPQATGSLNFSPKNGPPLYYNMLDFAVAKGFKNKKYDFMCTACNHSLDFGFEGASSTMQLLKKEGIAFSGLNETKADSEHATIVERKGFKVGLISHTFGLNAYQPPKDKPWIVNRTHLNGKLGEINLQQIERQLEHAKKSGVDVTVLQLHWGLEHEFYPRPEQLEVAHYLAEKGADVIVGHHPHVVQPVEYYRTKRDADRIVPIFYSLGNLVNPFTAAHLCLSYVARLQFAKGQTGSGQVLTYVKEAKAVSVQQEHDEKNQKIRLVPAKQ